MRLPIWHSSALAGLLVAHGLAHPANPIPSGSPLSTNSQPKQAAPASPKLVGASSTELKTPVILPPQSIQQSGSLRHHHIVDAVSCNRFMDYNFADHLTLAVDESIEWIKNAKDILENMELDDMSMFIDIDESNSQPGTPSDVNQQRTPSPKQKNSVSTNVNLVKNTNVPPRHLERLVLCMNNEAPRHKNKHQPLKEVNQQSKLVSLKQVRQAINEDPVKARKRAPPPAPNCQTFLNPA
ncbi:hypothetical protein EX30DRAFT_352220 [Ascodesmis nigricans]|uniref:Uncharacterized protein n=1 Tax=Ascodesmis nigricans TaxID=341454 RepID=A0A4S2MJ36_9PEZI|nr:hypothetical protein EX30DRAFT_352220 [Ascodesmis nigricans]